MSKRLIPQNKNYANIPRQIVAEIKHNADQPIKVQQLVALLPWGHHVLFYMESAIKNKQFQESFARKFARTSK
jgi:hypothetical protein